MSVYEIILIIGKLIMLKRLFKDCGSMFHLNGLNFKIKAAFFHDLNVLSINQLTFISSEKLL